jgi:hypothetical protein
MASRTTLRAWIATRRRKHSDLRQLFLALRITAVAEMAEAVAGIVTIAVNFE